MEAHGPPSTELGPRWRSATPDKALYASYVQNLRSRLLALTTVVALLFGWPSSGDGAPTETLVGLVTNDTNPSVWLTFSLDVTPLVPGATSAALTFDLRNDAPNPPFFPDATTSAVFLGFDGPRFFVRFEYSSGADTSHWRNVRLVIDGQEYVDGYEAFADHLGTEFGGTAQQGAGPAINILGQIGPAAAVYAMQIAPSCQQVVSVEFEALNSALDPNPGTGQPGTQVGLRIFPDRQSPDDVTDRSTVRVKATVNPASRKLTVYFKSFDVDDPSSNTAPIDPNGSAGDDNRGTPNQGTLSASSAETDLSGVAVVDFEVTKQPGDNFRVVAACDSNTLQNLSVDGLDIKDASGSALPTANANVTDVLTVWRKLHIEVDSMDAVSGNQVRGIVQNAVESKPLATVKAIVFRLRHGQKLPKENNRFESGLLKVAGTTSEFAITGTTIRKGFAGISVNNIVVLIDVTFGDTPVSIAKKLAHKAKDKGYELKRFFNKLVVASVNGQSPTVTGTGGDVGTGWTISASFFPRPEDVFTVKTSHTEGKDSKVVVGPGGPRGTDSFGNPLGFEGFPFILVDDDDFNGDDGATLDGDEGERVTAPDLSLIADSVDNGACDYSATNVFGAAYVCPVFDLPNLNPVVPFVLNTPDGADEGALLKAAYSFDNIGTEADSTFWTVYLLGAYQMQREDDCDPNHPEGCRLGQVDNDGQGATIFNETIRDLNNVPGGRGANCSNRAIVAHEIGHLFNGGDHFDVGLMATSCNQPLSFGDITIRRIREILHP